MAGSVQGIPASFLALHDRVFLENDPRRDARWHSVLKISDAADVDTIEVLARLAFATKAPAAGHRDERLSKQYAAVVAALQDGDGGFDPARSGRELQLTAAAALMQLLPRNADASLAVVLASFGGRRADLPLDMTGEAENALAALSNSIHRRDATEAKRSPAPAIAFTLDDAALANLTPQAVKSALEELRDAVAKALASLADRHAVAMAAQARRTAAADEELQMLWWLTNGMSLSRDLPFGELGSAERALVLAGELAEMTNRSPGPASIQSLLSRAGVEPRMLAVTDAVNAVHPDWASSMSNMARVSPVTTPLHFGLEKRVETSSPDAWQHAWSATTGVPADLSVPAEMLGLAFYRERLLLTVET